MESGGCPQHPGAYLVWSGGHSPATLWDPLDFPSGRPLTVEARWLVLLGLERKGAVRARIRWAAGGGSGSSRSGSRLLVVLGDAGFNFPLLLEKAVNRSQLGRRLSCPGKPPSL